MLISSLKSPRIHLPKLRPGVFDRANSGARRASSSTPQSSTSRVYRLLFNKGHEVGSRDGEDTAASEHYCVSRSPVTKNEEAPSAKREDAISNSEVHLYLNTVRPTTGTPTRYGWTLDGR